MTVSCLRHWLTAHIWLTVSNNNAAFSAVVPPKSLMMMVWQWVALMTNPLRGHDSSLFYSQKFSMWNLRRPSCATLSAIA